MQWRYRVDPVALACVRHSLASGLRAGFVAGFRAATPDALYAPLGVWALTAATQWLMREHFWLNLGGGLVLILLGMRAMRGSEPTDVELSGGADHGCEQLSVNPCARPDESVDACRTCCAVHHS